MTHDREQLSRLYTLYAPTVYRRCRYLLRDDEEARDAMHDVFIKVQDKFKGFRGQASPLTWINRIATNHCLNILRSRKARWRQDIQQVAKVAEQSRDNDHAALERQDLVRAILARCDKSLQEIAIYYFVDAMKQEEIAQLVGISVPTLRKRLRHFLQIARRELQVQFPDLVLKEALL